MSPTRTTHTHYYISTIPDQRADGDDEEQGKAPSVFTHSIKSEPASPLDAMCVLRGERCVSTQCGGSHLMVGGWRWGYWDSGVCWEFRALQMSKAYLYVHVRARTYYYNDPRREEKHFKVRVRANGRKPTCAELVSIRPPHDNKNDCAER